MRRSDTPDWAEPLRGQPSPRRDVSASVLLGACLITACATVEGGHPVGGGGAVGGGDGSALHPLGGTPLAGEASGAAGAPAPASAQPPQDEKADSSWLPEIHGQLYSRLRIRGNGDETDVDIYEILSLDVGDPAQDVVTGHLMGRIAFDFDRSQEFFGLTDTYDSDVTGQLYYLYADYHGFDLFPKARLGRQQLASTPVILSFDGLTLATRPLGEQGFEIGAYGGIPVHHYESSSSGDEVLGTYVEARPWEGGRARLDWMHLKDEKRTGNFENDLLSLDLWQSIQRTLFLEAGYTRLDDSNRDLRAVARWLDAESDLMVQARYYQLFEPLEELVNELDPYYASLLTYYPYRTFGFLAAQGFGQTAHLQAGLDLRRVDDEDDVGEFNRDYDRAYVTAALHRLFGSGFELAMTGDWWNGDGQDINTLGFELGHDLGSNVNLALGSYFSLYKYNLFLVSERDNVRTWFLRGRWKRTGNRTLEVVYDYEDAEFDNYHTLRVEAAWRF